MDNKKLTQERLELAAILFWLLADTTTKKQASRVIETDSRLSEQLLNCIVAGGRQCLEQHAPPMGWPTAGKLYEKAVKMWMRRTGRWLRKHRKEGFLAEDQVFFHSLCHAIAQEVDKEFSSNDVKAELTKVVSFAVESLLGGTAGGPGSSDKVFDWDILRNIPGFSEAERSRSDLNPKTVANHIAMLMLEGKHATRQSPFSTITLRDEWRLSCWALTQWQPRFLSFVANALHGAAPAEKAGQRTFRTVTGNLQQGLLFHLLTKSYDLLLQELWLLHVYCPVVDEVREYLLALQCPSCRNETPQVTQPLNSLTCLSCQTPLECTRCGQPPNLRQWTCGCGPLGKVCPRCETPLDVQRHLLKAKRRLVIAGVVGTHTPTYVKLGKVLTKCPTGPRKERVIAARLLCDAYHRGLLWQFRLFELLTKVSLAQSSADISQQVSLVQLKDNLNFLGRFDGDLNKKGRHEDSTVREAVLQRLVILFNQLDYPEVQQQMSRWKHGEARITAFWDDIKMQVVEPYLTQRAAVGSAVHYVPVDTFPEHQKTCAYAHQLPSKRPSGNRIYLKFCYAWNPATQS